MVPVPTVPQSSIECQPVPICTPELMVVPPKSERSCSVPEAWTKALMTGPLPAERRRNRSTPVPDEMFTFALTHGVIVDVPRSRYANADWFVTVRGPTARPANRSRCRA